MKKFIAFLLCITALIICLTACKDDRKYIKTITYPHFEYTVSSARYSENNRTINVHEGYMLSEGHPYDEIETDNGYDLVFHLVPVEGK